MFEVNKWLEKKVFGMGNLFEYKICPRLVKQAKTKAYWKDRAGHARQNINGGVEGSGNKFEIYLAHGTEYGEWLERDQLVVVNPLFLLLKNCITKKRYKKRILN